jgi:hypothetical protein
MVESLVEMRHAALLFVGIGGLVLGIWPLIHVCRRMGRMVLRRPQHSWGMTRYISTIATGAFLTGVGTASLGLWMALASFGDVGHKTQVAEIQCIELGPGKLRLYYVAFDKDGRRGSTETYDLAGDEWEVGGDLVRFRSLLGKLGVDTVYQVTRVEGRWLQAADANSHKATAFDRAATTSGWLALYQHGTRGPLGWLVQGVNGGAVSQLPDRRALYNLYVTNDGFIVDKKAF